MAMGQQIETSRPVAAEPGSAAKPARLMSLDVFRGATMASMLLVNNPGDWNNLYAPLDHAEWNGWTFTDLIFPFFLWIVGVAIPFSLGRKIEAGEEPGKLFFKVLRRSLILVAVGIALNGFPFYDFSTIRIPGVLQRIGVCYFFAATIYLMTGIRGQMAAIVTLLIGYWLLMAFGPVPGVGHGMMTLHGNFSEYIDSQIFGHHVWREMAPGDPEGSISTLPAIASVLFGIMAGHILRTHKSQAEQTAWLFVTGTILLFIGSVWDWVLPINKKLWTSSYSVFMAGMATIIFALTYWLVDVQSRRKLVKPLAIYGMNAITVFVLTGLIGRLTTLIKFQSGDKTITVKTYLYEHLKAVFEAVGGPLATPKNSSHLYAVGYVLLMYGVCYVMYRKKWFVRL
jgi:predicted acyltransferase